MGLISWIIVGLIAGAAARGLLPGPDKMGVGATILVGMSGSVVGGFIFNLIGPGSIFSFRRAGLIGSIIGGVVVLAGYRAVQRTGEGS